MTILGWILIGWGFLLLVLNRGARSMDNPDAQRTTNVIGVAMVFAGLVVLGLSYGN